MPLKTGSVQRAHKSECIYRVLHLGIKYVTGNEKSQLLVTSLATQLSPSRISKLLSKYSDHGERAFIKINRKSLTSFLRFGKV